MGKIFVLITQIRNQTNRSVGLRAYDRYCPLPVLPPGKTRTVKLSRILRCSRAETDFRLPDWKIRVLVDDRFTGIELEPLIVLAYARVLFRYERSGDGSDVLCVDGVPENWSDFWLRHKYFGFVRNRFWDKRPSEPIARSDSRLATKLRDLKADEPRLAPFVRTTMKKRSSFVSLDLGVCFSASMSERKSAPARLEKGDKRDREKPVNKNVVNSQIPIVTPGMEEPRITPVAMPPEMGSRGQINVVKNVVNSQLPTVTLPVEEPRIIPVATPPEMGSRGQINVDKNVVNSQLPTITPLVEEPRFIPVATPPEMGSRGQINVDKNVVNSQLPTVTPRVEEPRIIHVATPPEMGSIGQIIVEENVVNNQLPTVTLPVEEPRIIPVATPLEMESRGQINVENNIVNSQLPTVTPPVEEPRIIPVATPPEMGSRGQINVDVEDSSPNDESSTRSSIGGSEKIDMRRERSEQWTDHHDRVHMDSFVHSILFMFALVLVWFLSR